MTTPVMDPAQTMVGTSRGVGLWIAPVGTAGPTGLTADFASPWEPLGYASDDGVTLAGDITSESFTPWQSTTPIKTIITERTRTVGFTLWQLNQRTLGLYFDEDVPGTGADFDFEARSDSMHQYHAIGVDAQDGDRRFRVVYPRATIESTGDMTLARGSMAPLEVTLSALDVNGVMAHIWVGATPTTREALAEGQATGSTATARTAAKSTAGR